MVPEGVLGKVIFGGVPAHPLTGSDQQHRFKITPGPPGCVALDVGQVHSVLNEQRW